MNARGRCALLAIGVLVFAAPEDGSAHGPCDCVKPSMAFAGARVRLEGSPAYRIVFNPGPAQFEGTLTPRYLASAYDPGVPTRTVLSRPRGQAEQPASFRVPRVPPGLYMLQIFDGLEAGQHLTWGYLHVAGEEPRRDAGPRRPGLRRDRARGRFEWGAAGVGALGGVLIGGAAAMLARRRTRR